MAESIVKDFKGKMDWVYVGKSEAPKPKETKADTLFHEYMQKVFDVAAPIAIAEIEDVSVTQGGIAQETVDQIVPLSLQKDVRDKPKFIKKWLEWEAKASSPDHQNRLGKLLTSAVYMAGSFGLNYGGNLLANKIFLDPKKDALHFPFKKTLSLSDESGNKEMLKAGWEYVTDAVTEQSTDRSVKWLTNREDIGFVSPLSRALGKLGNTAITVFGDLKKHDTKTFVMNSFVNPGFIEGLFRFVGAIPGGGFVKELYGKGNAQIMKGEGMIPFGTDLAFNMLIAKMIYKQKPIGD